MATRVNEKSSRSGARKGAKKERERERGIFLLLILLVHGLSARVRCARLLQPAWGRRPSWGSGSRSSITYRTERETWYSAFYENTGRDPLAVSMATSAVSNSMPLLNNVFDLWTILRINYTAVSLFFSFSTVLSDGSFSRMIESSWKKDGIG